MPKGKEMKITTGAVTINGGPGLAIGMILGTDTINLMLGIIAINIYFGPEEMLKQEIDDE